MTDITIATPDGKSFTAYVAMPATLPAPTIILIQEIFGVNQEMREKCDLLAQAGYIAVCPDLFWRLEPGVQLTDKTKEEWAKAFDLMTRFDLDLGLSDLGAVLHTFRNHADSTGRVGCVGYCLGGKIAYLMAARTDIDVSVSYYGVGLDALTGEVGAVKKPLLMHIAEEDKFVPKDAQEKIKAAVAANPSITAYSYPGVNHAFARLNGDHYDADAAHSADQRTLDILNRNLK